MVSDGSTDANLIPIIDWVLKHSAGVQLSEGQHADFFRLHQKPRNAVERLLCAVDNYPCEVLFIHRDAEKEEPQVRFDEIKQAFQRARLQLPAVAVVPVRMLEAWMCFDENAVRMASGNPNCDIPLNLPKLKRIESRPDPKQDLKEALLAASGLAGRRLKKFNANAAFWRLVDCIEDFSALRELPSFRAFEDSVKSLSANGWKPGFYN